MSVERFVIIHSTFGNNTPDFKNDSWWSGSGSGGGDHDDHVICSHWSCLNDFTFAVLILVNWRKFLKELVY